jgi:hypothetical protein
MMQPNTIRVVAAVLDTRQLTLYKEDGEPYVIKQGDSRLQDIINTVVPQLAASPGTTIEVQIAPPELNHFATYEAETNGVVRFFRMAKNKLRSLFSSSEDDRPVIMPQVQVLLNQDNGIHLPDPKMQHAVSQIMAHAQPASDPNFTTSDIKDESDDTIVAVVEKETGPEIIEDAHRLRSQVKHAIENNRILALQKFMERLATVKAKRNHSAQELLKFLECGDLPIADDGCIIIYKALRKNNRNEDQLIYSDIHTGKVIQGIGSKVFMNESLVDPDRRNECSNGLHVARRQYLRNFGGDICVLAKVAPEDVIAVPEYDANKMRVAAYHILFELPPEAYRKLKDNRPFDDVPAAMQMLALALRGQHTTIVNTVEITEHYGNGIKVTHLDRTPEPVTSTEPVETVKTVQEINSDNESNAPMINPKTVAKTAQAVTNNSRQARAAVLVTGFNRAKNKAARLDAAKALLDFKRSSKVSWENLGVPADVSAQVLSLTATK